MTHLHEQYAARADEARAEAEGTSLDNVRERCLRSAAAWEAMAARARRSDTMRAKLLAEKEAALAETADH
ncbi:MAG TPA: hypothetical protein VH331_06205 [Allosphingosinicella sp.]|jgi:hypothetical protein|nr:hypothetical protein [Allosphingosinicella sp.]